MQEQARIKSSAEITFISAFPIIIQIQFDNSSLILDLCDITRGVCKQTVIFDINICFPFH